MNKLDQLFQDKKSNILNIYFTAGYPQLNDTLPIIDSLEALGVDLIEVGIPYSDPLADGPTIQESGTKAIANGMTLQKLFEQLAERKAKTPIILMGYLNQVMQFGVDAFIEQCVRVGVDGLILPDLPIHEYEQVFKAKLEKANLRFSFLVTPQTSEERRQKIDALSDGFVYIVSSSSITGTKAGFSSEQIAYLQKMKNARWKNPTLIGFGISDADSYNTVCQYANGAIIGSAFIKALDGGTNLQHNIESFIRRIR